MEHELFVEPKANDPAEVVPYIRDLAKASMFKRWWPWYNFVSALPFEMFSGLLKEAELTIREAKASNSSLKQSLVGAKLAMGISDTLVDAEN